jgi:ubiquinone/menaquinone biosynthesis C-methylase UbiE
MKNNLMSALETKYVLATGEEAASRLRVVNTAHGHDTRALLKRAGLKAGMRVADIGCGVGTLSHWAAERIGPIGSVVGVDVSECQVEQARAGAKKMALKNVEFVHAGAYETGLPGGGFDMVFCRFLLMHLEYPERALTEMSRLVKPGGVLVCEEGDFNTPYCVPHSPMYDRCFALYTLAGESQCGHFQIGNQVYRMFLNLGYKEPMVNNVQPVFARGEAKKLPAWTLEECADLLIEKGLSTPEEISEILKEMHQLAKDDTILFGMARMTQVWARKSKHQ